MLQNPFKQILEIWIYLIVKFYGNSTRKLISAYNMLYTICEFNIMYTLFFMQILQPFKNNVITNCYHQLKLIYITNCIIIYNTNCCIVCSITCITMYKPIVLTNYKTMYKTICYNHWLTMHKSIVPRQTILYIVYTYRILYTRSIYCIHCQAHYIQCIVYTMKLNEFITLYTIFCVENFPISESLYAKFFVQNINTNKYRK